MVHRDAKDLFQLQSELVEMKVNMAVSKEIDRVIEQITGLKKEIHVEMHGLKSDMNKRFSSLDNRVIAVETKLGMANETRKLIRAKFIDYSFQTGWLIMGAVLTYVLIQLHVLIK